MALAEQTVNISFAQGIDTKTDPWQLQIGKFLSLVNSVFTDGDLLVKRNGYGLFPGTAPSSNYLTTLNGNLLSVGSTISAYSSNTQSWISKGSLQPVSLSVLPLIRNNLNQIQVDSAEYNGLVLVTYTQLNVTNSGQVTNYFYAVEDAVTGQSIVPPTAIPVLLGGAITGSSRVFVVGGYFVVVSPVLVSSTTYLQYFSVSGINPSIVSAAQNTYPEGYVPLSTNPGWDGAVTSNTLVIAYNTTSGGQGVHVTSLTAAQISGNLASGVVRSFTNSAYIAGLMSVCADQTSNPNIVYISFWNPSTRNAYICGVYLGLNSLNTSFTPYTFLTSASVANIASVAQNSLANIYVELANTYSYDSNISSNLISGFSANFVGSNSLGTIIRGVGLASKAFIANGSIYFLSAYQSTYQPSYFLINASQSLQSSPVIAAKLAYQNGGGYLSLGLPSVSVNGNTASIPYLYKQNVEALNTLNNTQQTTAGGIYSQLGINQVSFQIGTQNIASAEIAKNLHLSGGFLSMFDGFYPVEHNFFLFPDNVETTYLSNSAVTPTGTTVNGSNVITSVSSVSGVYSGMTITGAGIPANATVLYVGTNTITISTAATASNSGVTFTIQGNIAAKPDGSTNTKAYFYQVTYEWTDMQGNAFRSQPSIPVSVTTSGSGAAGSVTINVPTLRLTTKISSPVKIVIYRWSVQTQVYNQVTSIVAPVLNSTTADSVTFVDTLPDASVVGNNILYTTGGVAPDTNGPASNILTLFDTRLFLVPAEDPNTLWVSKSVLEGVPVELSSGFTIYVSPNAGTTVSSGPITAAAPMDDKIILFKKNSIFYINGTGPDNLGTTAPGCPLGNYSPPIFITSVVGCMNQQSIVLTQDGLLFQSDKGIWRLGRDLSTTYIGAPVEAYNSSTVTSAQVIPGTNYVLFSLNTGEMLMYDYFYGQWGTFKGVPTQSSCIYNNLHTVLTQYGQIVQETPGIYLDGDRPVLMSFTTSWLNLASLQGYERFYEFYLLARYLSPHTLVAQVAYDYNPSNYHASTISPMNYSPATASPFGVPSPFGAPVSVEQWRIHAKQQLCQSFQISVNEVFNPNFGTTPGAGFTMSGINCKVGIKKSRRPIRGSNSVG